MTTAASELYTCIAKCKVCEAELDRAVHVPSEHQAQVNAAAPLGAICAVKEHNTSPDCNLNIVLEWYRETAQGLQLALVTGPTRPS